MADHAATCTFAHLSDLHVDGSPARAQALARTVRALVTPSATLDFAVVTGDIAQHGLAQDYDEVRRAFATFGRPVLFCPCNHDLRSAFAARLLGMPASAQALHCSTQYPSVMGLALDSTIPGEDGGTLGQGAEELVAAQLSGLPAYLPVVIALHHMPLDWHPSCLASLDAAGVRAVRRILRRHGSIAAVLGGHFHNAMTSVLEGVSVVAAPSVASRIAPPWEHVDDVVVDQPVIAIHSLDGAGSLTSYFRRVS